MAIWIAVGFGPFSEAAAGGDLSREAALRRPIAMAEVGGHLYVANQRTGSVSVVDLSKRKVVAEHAVAAHLAGLAATPTGDLLAVDDVRHELIHLRPEKGALWVVQRLAVSHTPVGVVVSADGSFAAVASLWSRRVTLIDLPRVKSGQREMRVRRVIDLPFAPRKMLIVRDDARLILADAFAGRIGVVDTKGGELVAVRSVDGHNIRGLALSRDGRSIHLTHSMLDQDSPTTRKMVFYGFVNSSVVRTVALDHLFESESSEPNPSEPGRASEPGRVGPDTSKRPQTIPIAHWQLHALGETNNGAGDPGDIVMPAHNDHAAVVALSGVNEVAFWPSASKPFERLKVGKRPTALTVSRDGRTVYVASTFDDSVTLLDTQRRTVGQTIALGPHAPRGLTDRGEELFYSARMSLHGWASCHSCHPDGHTTGRLNDNLGDSTFGTPKRILSLMGVADTEPWAWDGSQDTLSHQVRKSLSVTMQGAEPKTDTVENAEAIDSFLRSLPPAPSLRRARGTLDRDAAERGRTIFRDRGCTQCHSIFNGTTNGRFDVGLSDESGWSRFNPPSLRGVSQRDAFFHDNRAKSLREVLRKYAHPYGDVVKREEIDDLVHFLESL